MAVFVPFFSNAVRSSDSQEALAALVAVQINQVLREIIDCSEADQLDAAAMFQVGDRFGYLIDSVRNYCPEPGSEVQRILRAAERCRSAAFAATRDQAAGRRFLRSFESLNEWVQQRGVIWPPALK